MLLDFDGVAEFWMYKLEDFFSAAKEQYWREKVEPDEAYMLDRSRMRMVFSSLCQVTAVD